MNTNTAIDKRPKIFYLPSRIAIIPANLFQVTLSDDEAIEAILARIKLSADDVDSDGHQLTASLEYIDHVKINLRNGILENIIHHVNQACWWRPNNNVLSTDKDAVLELILGYKLNNRLYALEDNEHSRTSESRLYGFQMLTTIHDPKVSVTLIDMNYSWRWQITFQLHSDPFNATAISKLIEL